MSVFVSGIVDTVLREAKEFLADEPSTWITARAETLASEYARDPRNRTARIADLQAMARQTAQQAWVDQHQERRTRVEASLKAAESELAAWERGARAVREPSPVGVSSEDRTRHSVDQLRVVMENHGL